MQDAFNPIEFLDYLRARWRVLAAACAIAAVLALAGSLMLPKRYTATAVIVIEPPGGSDARNGTAVSPMYLVDHRNVVSGVRSAARRSSGLIVESRRRRFAQRTRGLSRAITCGTWPPQGPLQALSVPACAQFYDYPRIRQVSDPKVGG